ncbi:pectinesterase-like [Olea europaea var. sylvestris]|uniref:Pectinesterase n=1 Tax=Olea europaea subsp. europaea TaxID=158383 RepID=A0A8S0T636_OLEEU|nr:pectinesterase-like [Olea europaea var. sylvestris]CAA3000425.1 pectinesterase-like [Olea europaea subsp. europaea]
MVRKVAISAVSLILVVGVVIGVVAVVHRSDSSENDKHNMSASMKAVTTICAPTSYKDACVRSLESVAKNETATPKDYIMAAIQATLDEVKKSFEVTSKTVVNNDTDPYNHMAVEDCKDLLDDAIDTLQASYSGVGDSDMHTIQDRANELRSWLTAVYALQSTCLDQIEKPEYKSAIENGMINATQLTHNAINIMAELSEVLKAFNVPLNLQANRRRLLDVGDQIGEDGYPTWFRAADRKLLAAHQKGGVAPNAVVAKDGSGQFKTVAAAIAAYPKNFKGRYTIYVKAGVYEEFITIDKKKPNVFIYGDGPGKTIITGKRNYGIMKIGTMNTATFSAVGQGFIARGLTFRNDAGPDGHQAVALRVQSDMSAIFDCSIEGYQDTLYYHAFRQFYRNCVISGTVDFIFGTGDAVIQNSLIIVRKPNANQQNTITADGREVARGTNGLVLQNCRIVPEKELFPLRFQIPTYLGRPWKANALTVVMQSELGDLIRPEGWMIWAGASYHQTCEFYEFANRGPGSITNKRSKEFKHFEVLNAGQAAKYTPGQFLSGFQWLKNTGAPFQLGL